MVQYSSSDERCHIGKKEKKSPNIAAETALSMMCRTGGAVKAFLIYRILHRADLFSTQHLPYTVMSFGRNGQKADTLNQNVASSWQYYKLELQNTWHKS
jgi:hypothetical protein